MNVVAFVVFQDVLHNCQLHRISFCADDKTDKRIFTFICKDSESNKHLCYVFDSEKCVGVICVCFFSPPIPHHGGTVAEDSQCVVLTVFPDLKATRRFPGGFGDFCRLVVVDAGGGNNSNHRSGL